jgi:hypothetical protein
VQVSVPASLIELQSALMLHWTQVPANTGLVASPQTCFGDWLSAVQSVPVGAGVKLGASGEPEHAGVIRQTLFDTGKSVASLTEVRLPAPLQATFWQSPGVWSPAGATVLSGNTQAPVASQPVAPQIPPVGLHAAVQQLPDPVVPQTPDVQALLAEQVPPGAALATHVPEAPGF